MEDVAGCGLGPHLPPPTPGSSLAPSSVITTLVPPAIAFSHVLPFFCSLPSSRASALPYQFKFLLWHVGGSEMSHECTGFVLFIYLFLLIFVWSCLH